MKKNCFNKNHFYFKAMRYFQEQFYFLFTTYTNWEFAKGGKLSVALPFSAFSGDLYLLFAFFNKRENLILLIRSWVALKYKLFC